MRKDTDPTHPLRTAPEPPTNLGVIEAIGGQPEYPALERSEAGIVHDWSPFESRQARLDRGHSKHPNEVGVFSGPSRAMTDPRFERPAEVDILTGDATKARKVMGWDPKVSFSELVEMMVRADLKAEAARAPR